VFGRAAHLAGVVVTGAEREITVPVHGRHRREECVDADVLGQEPRGLGEITRDIGENLASAILFAPLDQSPLDRGNEHAVRMNAVAQFVAQNRLTCDTRRFKVIDLQVVDLTCGSAIRQRL